MAAINGLTLSQWDDLVDSEWISQRVNMAVDTPKTYTVIANVIDIGGRSTRTYAHPLQSHGTAASSTTESDLVTTSNTTSTEVTVGVTLVDKATFVTVQAAGASVWDTTGAAVDFVTRACRLYIDDAFHALSSSMSNTIGDNATTMDLDQWVTGRTTFMAQAKNPGASVFVAAVDGFRDLSSEIMTSTAAILGSDRAAAELFGSAAGAMAQGVVTTIGGIPVIVTDEIPAADTTGWGNYFTTIGSGDGALGLVVKSEISVVMKPEPLRHGSYFIGSCDVGVGILDDARCLQVVSKT